MEIPVFLITGFLESGKTSFIMETMKDPEFYNGEKTLIVACEEGEEEYDEEILEKLNTQIVYVEDNEEFTDFYFKDLKAKYEPDRVIIEYNGMWSVDDILDTPMPKDWMLVQVITTVDASTFDSYINNMRQLIVQQMTYSDTVIFNRCDEETKKNVLRRNVKIVNPKAQIVYEGEDGMLPQDDEDDLPYDINSEIIELEDDDYGLWYIDASDKPERYDGKMIKFTAMVCKPRRFPKGWFVPGRHAMTCCEDDIRFLGFVCKSDKADKLSEREWVKIVAEIKCENHKVYGGPGPVLYAKKVEYTDEPKEKLVYFT